MRAVLGHRMRAAAQHAGLARPRELDARLGILAQTRLDPADIFSDVTGSLAHNVSWPAQGNRE